MGLFSKNIGYEPRRRPPFNLTTFMIIVGITLILIQAFGLLFKSLNIKLGPVFLLFAVAAAGISAFAIFKKMFTDTPLTKQDIFGILVVVTVALLMLFFLRKLVPEIFTESFVQLQSMIGL